MLHLSVITILKITVDRSEKSYQKFSFKRISGKLTTKHLAISNLPALQTGRSIFLPLDVHDHVLE